MSGTLDASRVESLVAFVDARVRREGCDHTHRFTEDWGRRQSVDWPDLLDILEANGAFCDCEVVLNLVHGIDLQAPAAAQPRLGGNDWLLPPDFECAESATFTKMIVCQAGLGRNTYSADGELLVPAPKGAKARRRVRKSVHFFVGCQTGLPSEVGVVRACGETSAADFARKVAGCGFEELARFTFREAGFVLSRIAVLQPSMAVGSHYADRVGIASRREELVVHRVIMRR